MPNDLTPLLPGEMTEDADLLDQAIQDLREIHLRKGLEYHLELGSYIIRTFFNDDNTAYATRAKKHLSYRALTAREDLPMSYSTLHAAVRVRHQFDALPEDVRSELTMSHHRALLPLRNDKARVRLARKTQKDHWSVVKLKSEVARTIEQDRQGETRGRKPLPRFEKTLRLMKRTLEEEDAFADLDKIEGMDVERAQELRGVVERMKAMCEELAVELAKVDGGEE